MSHDKKSNYQVGYAKPPRKTRFEKGKSGNTAGRVKGFRLIVNLPLRSGKSLVTSVLWPAWVWAKQASTRWLCASYSASVAVKFSIGAQLIPRQFRR
jgi:hypothetical protein